MPWTGTGTFTRIYSWVAQKNAGYNIIASQMDDDTDDITANGFGNTLTRDGQGFATADLPMAGFKHTGVGNASARTQYAATGQIQDNSFLFAVGAGTGDAITATLSPAVTAVVDGMQISVRMPGTNTITTPTLALNGLTARTITKGGGGALAVGEYAANQAATLRYKAAGTTWELLTAAGLSAIADLRVLGNNSGGAALPSALTASQVLKMISTTQGVVLYYNGTDYVALGTGTNGQFLQTQGASANPRWASPSIQSQTISASGNFTIPAGASSTTRFQFKLQAAGSGGGGVSTNDGAAAGGGGSGEYIEVVYTGFTAGQNVAVVIGAAGAGGAAGSAGTTAAETTIAYAAVVVATAGYSAAGTGATAATGVARGGGLSASSSASAGASGLTLVSSSCGAAGGAGNNGAYGVGGSISGAGASSQFGRGGDPLITGGPGNGGIGFGSGGSGGYRSSTTDRTGGAGAPGCVIVEWVL